MDPVIEQLRGKVIASCQAYMGEPLRHPETMAQMARACELGGAGGIRCQGLSDIAAIKGRTEVPVIGIWKEGHEGVYITPTLRHARACVMAGADIVAVDATDRPRPDGKTLEDTVRPLKEEGVLVMADCATIEDIRHAFAIGCDIASTTLSHPGAAIDCGMADGPDVALVRQAVEEFPASLSSAKGVCTRPPMPRRRWTPVHGPWWSVPRSRIRPASRAGSSRLPESKGCV